MCLYWFLLKLWLLAMCNVYNVFICNHLCLLLVSLNQVADSTAYCSGIRPKDVIVKCDGIVVRSTLEVFSILACAILSLHENDSLFLGNFTRTVIIVLR